jgi:hypothetical protein
VFINKKGRRIPWYYSDKLQKNPPNKPDDDLDDLDDEIIDEEDPESQESHGWLESGKPPPTESSGHPGAGSSNYQGKKASTTNHVDNTEDVDVQGIVPQTTDIFQEMHELAVSLNPQLVRDQQNMSPKLIDKQVRVLCAKPQATPLKYTTNDALEAEVVAHQEASEFGFSGGFEMESQLIGIHENLSRENIEALEEHAMVSNLTEDSTTSFCEKSGDSVVILILEENLKANGYQGDEDVDKRMKLSEVLYTDKVLFSQMAADVPTTAVELLAVDKTSCCTRQSSRVQDKEIPMLQKARARKAGTKGTTSCPKPSSPQPSCSLDVISKVCGFSLGLEEETRLANISLIQAKEEALVAMLLTKQKILSSSSEIRGLPNKESSLVQQNPGLELNGG